jgi:hypothetical protein
MQRSLYVMQRSFIPKEPSSFRGALFRAWALCGHCLVTSPRQGSFVVMQGSFVVMQGSFVVMQGSFFVMQGSFVRYAGFLSRTVSLQKMELM